MKSPIRPTKTNHLDEPARSYHPVGCTIMLIVASCFQRYIVVLMEQFNPENLSAPLSRDEMTELVTSTLFYVYDSKRPLTVSDVLSSLVRIQPDIQARTNLVDTLFKQNYLMKHETQAGYSRPEVVFGTAGLWLLESAFMHGEESIDSMALAQRILDQNGFFRQ